ncbi:MAG: GNAT family N-acetyltransferase [Mobilitalea sp.]
MTQKKSQHSIRLMEFISENEYEQLNKLQELCHSNDQTNLKLELDYKLYVGSISKNDSRKINEFLYYVDNTLVAYLGISSFGGNIGEINGMTHPEWRRKGIFKRLFSLVTNECQTRNFTKLLLLCDGKSDIGIDFIKSVGGAYDFSEYRMKLNNNSVYHGMDSVTLRTANKTDRNEIARQNALFFNDIEENSDNKKEDDEEVANALVEEDAPNAVTYMVELKDEIIGKIKVEFGESTAFIYGFGIHSEHRGKGYGKAALKETLRIILEKNIEDTQLDVVCTNDNALNLYKACGFEEQSIMNYYQFHMNN